MPVRTTSPVGSTTSSPHRFLVFSPYGRVADPAVERVADHRAPRVARGRQPVRQVVGLDEVVEIVEPDAGLEQHGAELLVELDLLHAREVHHHAARKQRGRAAVAEVLAAADRPDRHAELVGDAQRRLDFLDRRRSDRSRRDVVPFLDRELVAVPGAVEALEEHLVRPERAFERALRLGQLGLVEARRQKIVFHQLIDQLCRAGGRVPASSRITSPFRSGLRMMKSATSANSSARPARLGNSASLSSSATKSSGRKADHRRRHEPRGDAHHADRVLRQVARPDQRQRRERSLRRGVGAHPLLPAEAGDRAGVDDHPAFAVGARGLVADHPVRDMRGDRGRAEQVDLDHRRNCAKSPGPSGVAIGRSRRSRRC